MSNQASLRSVVRVGVGARETQSSVPGIRGSSITRAQSDDLCLSSGGGILSSLVGTADVGQLIVNSVGDDGWVKSLLLSLVDDGIDGLES